MNPLEAKLAETAPKRPLAVTIGAAVATLVVIAGVLTGPTILSCSNSPEGFAACFSGKLSDIGVLPKPAPVAVAEAPPAQEEPAAQTATPEPEAALPANIPDIIGPTFGLLRAQPDGSVVIAGSGKPGTEVEVFANDDSIGKTPVEQSGDWVLVPEKPLPPSGVELTVGEAGSAQRSGQSFVVVIDPEHKAEPLVVASVPGKASEVLQGLVKPGTEVPADIAVAQAPVNAPGSNVPGQTAAPAVTPPAIEVAEAPAAADETPAPPSAAAPPAEPPAAPAAEPQAAAQPAEPAAPAAEPAGQAAPAQDEPAAVAEAPTAPAEPPAAPQEPAAAPQEPAAQPAAAEPAGTQVAAAEPPAAIAAPAAPQPQTEVPALVASIDAIEIDGEKNFFAGAGTDGATIRLYVDDLHIADTVVRGGRWLVETTRNVLTKPSQLVRIDVLKAGSSEVATRAEVNFEIDLPAVPTEQAPVAVAQAETPAVTPPAAAEPTAPAATPTPSQEPASAASQPQAEPQAEPAAAPPEPAPAAASDASVPTMVAVPIGNDPEAVRFASGKAIIRSGDNLWTIARRVYGQGIKYTTIYEANTGQIRDPHWIYPGQVFDLPEDEAE